MTAPRVALAGALLSLGGCGLFSGAVPQRPALPEAETPEQRACLEEARNSGPVRDLERQRNAQSIPNWERLAEESRVRINRAYRDCLRREGLALPGGVESPRSR